MALEPSSASTAPVTLPTRVPRGECSGTVINWYWGLPFCRERELSSQGLRQGPVPTSCQKARGRTLVGAEGASRPHLIE